MKSRSGKANSLNRVSEKVKQKWERGNKTRDERYQKHKIVEQ